MPSVHVCLVSDQLLPNVIPVLMEQPERVYLIATEEMSARQQDHRLARLLTERGCHVDLRAGAPSTDMPALREYALAIAMEVSQASGDRTIVLNATGGTKLLAMAFVEVFRDALQGYSFQIVYTDTAHQMLETIVPRGVPPRPMRSVLDVPTYLAVQGMTYRSAASDDEGWRGRAQARKSLSKLLGTRAVKEGQLIQALNGIAMRALDDQGKTLASAHQKLGYPPNGLRCEVLRQAARAELIDWQEGATELAFQDCEAARYLGGRWLEEYAWHCARDAGLEDARCSVVATWFGTPKREAPRNELDLLAVHCNRMLAVECKTSSFAGGGDSDQNVALKLESLSRKAGGAFGASLLVSARELSSSMRARCRSLGIDVLEGTRLGDLPRLLRQWKDAGRLSH